MLVATNQHQAFHAGAKTNLEVAGTAACSCRSESGNRPPKELVPTFSTTAAVGLGEAVPVRLIGGLILIKFHPLQGLTQL